MNWQSLCWSPSRRLFVTENFCHRVPPATETFPGGDDNDQPNLRSPKLGSNSAALFLNDATNLYTKATTQATATATESRSESNSSSNSSKRKVSLPRVGGAKSAPQGTSFQHLVMAKFPPLMGGGGVANHTELLCRRVRSVPARSHCLAAGRLEPSWSRA